MLDSIDEAIERAEAAIAATERLRVALLHELLTRGVPGWHTEWKDVQGVGMMPACWEVVRLGEVAEVATGGTPSRKYENYWAGTIPWMSSGEINLRPVTETAEHLTEEGLQNSNAKVFPAGTVMLAMNGQGTTRGKVSVLHIAAACNQSLAAIQAGSKCENGFLFHVLDSMYEDLRRMTGDGRSGLNLSLIRGVRIALPPLPEQRAIADALDSVEYTVQNGRMQTNYLTLLKESGAKALLTGLVRVRSLKRGHEGGTCS